VHAAPVVLSRAPSESGLDGIRLLCQKYKTERLRDMGRSVTEPHKKQLLLMNSCGYMLSKPSSCSLA
jgi:hypothetical protein